MFEQAGMRTAVIATVLVLTAAPVAAQRSGEVPQFAEEEYRINETAGEARITVGRSTAETAVTVNYSTTDAVAFPQEDGDSGVATPDADYKPASGKLEFPKGEKGPRAFKITIINDKVAENEESIFMTITDDTGVLDFTQLRIKSDEPFSPPGAAPAPQATGAAAPGGPAEPGKADGSTAAPGPRASPADSPGAAAQAEKRLAKQRSGAKPLAIAAAAIALIALLAWAFKRFKPKAG